MGQIISLTMATPKVSIPTEKAIDVTTYKNGGGSSFSGDSGTFYMQKPGMGTYVLRTQMAGDYPLWTAGSHTTWNGTAWVFQGVTDEGAGVKLYVNALNPDWAVGFRPSHLRVTYVSSPLQPPIYGYSLTLHDGHYHNIANSGVVDPPIQYDSGQELVITFQGYDFERVRLKLHSGGVTLTTTVTNIEFKVDGVWKSYLYEEPE